MTIGQTESNLEFPPIVHSVVPVENWFSKNPQIWSKRFWHVHWHKSRTAMTGDVCDVLLKGFVRNHRRRLVVVNRNNGRSNIHTLTQRQSSHVILWIQGQDGVFQLKFKS